MNDCAHHNLRALDVNTVHCDWCGRDFALTHAPDCPGRPGVRGICNCGASRREGIVPRIVKVAPTDADAILALASAVNSFANAIKILAHDITTASMRPRR